MMKPYLLSFLVLLFISSLLAQGGNVFSTTSGKISFQSDAPFELIKASSKEVKGLLDPAKKTFAFKVRMESFQGFNSALQKEHFNENYVESSKYPKAEFKGTVANNSVVNYSKDGTYNVTVKGKMTLHGITKDVEAPGTIKIEGGKVEGRSTFNIRLSDYKISVPSVVKDKVSNNIRISVDTRLEPLKS